MVFADVPPQDGETEEHQQQRETTNAARIQRRVQEAEQVVTAVAAAHNNNVTPNAPGQAASNATHNAIAGPPPAGQVIAQ